MENKVEEPQLEYGGLYDLGNSRDYALMNK
jgi:hypothetical protein